MCGIAGFYLKSQNEEHGSLCNYVKKMTDTLSHRGPDNSSNWSNEVDKIYLGHRRLSIIDLSTNANQPLHSNNNRYVIIFNGEIYNFLQLKKDLNKYKINFNNKSDTQVLIEYINFFGLKITLQNIIGMYAFVLWDKKKKELFLVRDKIGKKPLYWCYQNNQLIFASEIKAILAFPYFKKKVNKNSLSEFLRLSYIHSPNSIYEEMFKVEPGSYIKVNNKFEIKKKKFWDLKSIILSKKNKNFNNNKLSDFENLLEDAVEKRLVSDVPLGVLLSGGIDSSLVAALAQKKSPRKIKTFSMAFKDNRYDESKFAKKIAKILDTDHTEYFAEDFSVEDLVNNLANIYDEPFADSSQIPTFIICNRIKKDVSVALSGDGGDEVFLGYSRYFWGERISKINRIFPKKLRSILSNIILSIPPDKLNLASNFFFKKIIPPHLGDRLQKIGKIINASSDSSIYQKLIYQLEPQNFLLKENFRENKIFNLSNFPANYDFIQAMQYLDLITYLPGDILAKVDRASMANSLEIRSPLLDIRLVEYSLQHLEQKEKIRNGKGKLILRKILSKYLPENLINRPKMGFGVPLSFWLRGPLKIWMLDTLSEQKLKRQEIFMVNPVKQLIDDHISERRNNHYQLWIILMFQAWYDKWVD